MLRKVLFPNQQPLHNVMQPIFYTPTAASEDEIPSFDPQQIVIGPHLPISASGTRACHHRTFPGEFDFASWISGKGLDHQAPLTVIIDGDITSWPVNIGSHHGLKIMLVGELSEKAVFRRELAAYAADEPFDLIVLTHGSSGRDLFTAACDVPVVLRRDWLGRACPETPKRAGRPKRLASPVRNRDWRKLVKLVARGTIWREDLPRTPLGPEWSWPVTDSGHPFLRISPASGRTVLLPVP
jgi:hypothetical protein